MRDLFVLVLVLYGLGAAASLLLEQCTGRGIDDPGDRFQGIEPTTIDKWWWENTN